MRTILAALSFLMVLPAVAQEADTATLEAGRVLVIDNCAACHAVGTDDASTHPEAPAFRTLGERYPVDTLAEALAEGIMSGHPDMPVFAFDADQVDQIIAWLENIQTK